MRRTRHSGIAIGFGVAVLLAMIVCPVMAGAVPEQASSSCHEGHEPGDAAVALDAHTCCAAVTAAASLQPPDGAAAAATSCFTAPRPVAHSTADRALAARPGLCAPPLFVQHASLRN